MTIRAALTSVEFVSIPIIVSDGSDPTSNTVEFSFPLRGQEPDAWTSGSWEPGASPPVARIVVGPGADFEFEDPGRYDIYVRITDSPEVPAFIADELVVYTTNVTLASPGQLSDVLGGGFDPEDARVVQALQSASGLIRRYVGQHFTRVDDDEVELRGNWTERLWLPQRPVIDVTEVAVRWGWEGSFTMLDATAWTVDSRGLLLYHGSYWGGSTGVVQVTYSHGYDTIPEDIEAVCLSVASRSYSNAVGAVQKTLGSASITYEQRVSEAGRLGLTALEAAVLDGYKLAAQEAW